MKKKKLWALTLLLGIGLAVVFIGQGKESPKKDPLERAKRIGVEIKEAQAFSEWVDKVSVEREASTDEWLAVIHEGLARQLAWSQLQMKRGRIKSAQRSMAQVERVLWKWAEAQRRHAERVRHMSMEKTKETKNDSQEEE